MTKPTSKQMQRRIDNSNEIKRAFKIEGDHPLANSIVKRCTGCEIKGIANGIRRVQHFPKIPRSPDGLDNRCSRCAQQRINFGIMRTMIETMNAQCPVAWEVGEIKKECTCCHEWRDVEEFGRSSNKVADLCLFCSPVEHHAEEVFASIDEHPTLARDMVQALHASDHNQAALKYLKQLNGEEFPAGKKATVGVSVFTFCIVLSSIVSAAVAAAFF